MSDNRRIIDDQLYCHFVTFSCHRRRRLLDEDHPKRILLGQLNEQLDRQQATCVGFVVMPDHVHLMVWFPETGQLSRFMQLASEPENAWRVTAEDWENHRRYGEYLAAVRDMIDKTSTAIAPWTVVPANAGDVRLYTVCDAIITRLKQRGTTVVLAGMLAPPNMGPEYEKAFNAIYPDLARAHDIPFYPFFLDGVAADPALLLADGMHPNPEGIGRIVDRMLPLLEKVLAEIG